MFQLLVGIAVRTVGFAGHISQFFLAAQIFFNFTIASTATMPSFSNAPFTGHRSPSCRSVGACTSLAPGCVSHSDKPKTRRETGLVGAGRHKTLAPHPTFQSSGTYNPREHQRNIKIEKMKEMKQLVVFVFRCASIFLLQVITHSVIHLVWILSALQ